jgi:hypothetical protein
MEHQPDDDLDGCELNFRLIDQLTRDDEIAELLEEDEGALRSGDRPEAA